ncbi:DNA polymerase beta domain-containing protein [Candidatus Magnetoovum chiemensis]|nr:DNA polymerase beta domain-containing protein [Candidatus Magnetoovum chiemensis]
MTKEINNKIVKFLQPHGVKTIAIFGSYARGETTKTSDIDLLVEFSDKKTLFDLVAIENELSESLGIKVDLLTEKALSPYLVDSIKKQLVVIYE